MLFASVYLVVSVFIFWGNCKTGPISHVNSENGSLFPTLQNRSYYFETKPPTDPIPFGALNGVK
jgi:hypothetical protein